MVEGDAMDRDVVESTDNDFLHKDRIEKALTDKQQDIRHRSRTLHRQFSILAAPIVVLL
jgi:hypothetical protein